MVRLKEGETRTYTIPLRREFLKVPKWRRTKRAMSEVRSYLIKHTKNEDVKISRWINEYIWKDGGKNPAGRVRVNVKLEKDVVSAELVDLTPKAKRVLEAERKAAEEEEKKDKKQKETEKALTETTKKAEETKTPAKEATKSTKKKERKASKKELEKELSTAKEIEKKKQDKKRAAPSKKQELQMNK